MDMMFMNSQSMESAFKFMCACLSFGLYIVLGWVIPIRKIKDENTSKGAKRFYIFMLFVLGISPILYLIYSAIKGRMSKGNANSMATGGAAPPPLPTPNNPAAVPKGNNISQSVNAYTPAAAAGSETAAPSVVVQNPAPGNIGVGKRN